MKNYLVTSKATPTSSSINIPQLASFDTLEEAKTEAERILLQGHTEIYVWKLSGVPSKEVTVAWSMEG